MVRVTKTASTSIIRSGFNVDKDALDYAMQLPEEWKDKFRFAFVRNPFDRLVSAWQMFQKHPTGKAVGFDISSISLNTVLEVVLDDTIDVYGNDYWGNMKRHAIPITHPHYQIQDAVFVGRFERLESDWRSLCEKLAIEFQPLGRLKNSGRKEHYSSFYDSRTRKMATRIFADDLEMFGYRFENGISKAA